VLLAAKRKHLIAEVATIIVRMESWECSFGAAAEEVLRLAGEDGG